MLLNKLLLHFANQSKSNSTAAIFVNIYGTICLVLSQIGCLFLNCRISHKIHSFLVI